MTSHLCGINYVPGTDVACVSWRYYRAGHTSGEAARKIKIAPAPISSRFLCPRPPLLLRRLGLMLLFVLEVKKCFTRGSQKVLAFLWLISFRYGFFCFLALSAITNILHEPRDKSREIPWDNIDSRAWQTLACEEALLFGRVKRVSRERASERRSRERLASLVQIGELARRLGKLLARKQGKLYS